MDVFIWYVLAGAAVGFLVGVTGVGGGSLMTPMLLAFGFPPQVAVGTDLLYAAITKGSGVIPHHKKKHVNWRIVGCLAIGSIPASLLTLLALEYVFADAEGYKGLLTSSLGVMLLVTSVILLMRPFLLKHRSDAKAGEAIRAVRHDIRFWTVFMGITLGVFVTLSSVGAGVFGTAVLMMLYPMLRSTEVVGTDIAHAVPLTFIAGIGYMILGHVDFTLLAALLVGSLPAIHLGAHFSTKIPERVLQIALAIILLIMGVKYTFFGSGH